MSGLDIMASKRQSTPRGEVSRRIVKEVREPGLVVTPSNFKWVIGVLGGIVLLWIGGGQITDRFMASADSHWRTEEKAKKSDDEVRAKQSASEIQVLTLIKDIQKEVTTHEAGDIVSNAWVLTAIYDLTAKASNKWSDDCPREKLPPEECKRLEREAKLATDAATKAKDIAQQATKTSK